MATTAGTIATLQQDQRDKAVSPNQLALRRFRKNRLAMGGLILVLFFAFIALFADFISPFGPRDQSTLQEAPPMTAAAADSPDAGRIHILGTDSLGRDTLTLLMFGARISLTVGLFTEAIALAIGLPLGLLAGFYGGVADFIVMRFGEVMNSFPDLLFLIMLSAVFGVRSVFVVFFVLGLVGWVTLSRVIRAQVLQVKQMDFVTGARSIGARTPGIMLRHVLPNILGPIIVLVTLGIPGAILTEATLTFLGVGIDPSTVTWGTMATVGQATILSKPLQVILPSVAITILALAMTFVGDGMRDAFDPKSK
jgi:ABC-type dipeptide/oligopeptide/nickel transport system permease subunit